MDPASDRQEDPAPTDCEACAARAIEVTLLRTALEAVHAAARTALDADSPIWHPRRG